MRIAILWLCDDTGMTRIVLTRWTICFRAAASIRFVWSRLCLGISWTRPWVPTYPFLGTSRRRPPSKSHGTSPWCTVRMRRPPRVRVLYLMLDILRVWRYFEAVDGGGSDGGGLLLLSEQVFAALEVTMVLLQVIVVVFPSSAVRFACCNVFYQRLPRRGQFWSLERRFFCALLYHTSMWHLCSAAALRMPWHAMLGT